MGWDGGARPERATGSWAPAMPNCVGARRARQLGAQPTARACAAAIAFLEPLLPLALACLGYLHATPGQTNRLRNEEYQI